MGLKVPLRGAGCGVRVMEEGTAALPGEMGAGTRCLCDARQLCRGQLAAALWPSSSLRLCGPSVSAPAQWKCCTLRS